MRSATKRDTNAAIDRESLAARCLGNVQLVERLLKRFTEQLEEDLTTLAEALKGCDAETFRQVAHRLKGTSANVEAWGLHECAKEAEEAALSRDLDDLADQLERFREMHRELTRALEEQGAGE
jgi:HPt (histidine-containing phosphotransfer) domain-containing protein